MQKKWQITRYNKQRFLRYIYVEYLRTSRNNNERTNPIYLIKNNSMNNTNNNYCVILAGGKGRRLWPCSRESKPKQFIDFSAADALSFSKHTTASRRLCR